MDALVVAKMCSSALLIQSMLVGIQNVAGTVMSYHVSIYLFDIYNVHSGVGSSLDLTGESSYTVLGG